VLSWFSATWRNVDCLTYTKAFRLKCNAVTLRLVLSIMRWPPFER
jgi:hypothetical protein